MHLPSAAYPKTYHAQTASAAGALLATSSPQALTAATTTRPTHHSSHIATPVDAPIIVDRIQSDDTSTLAAKVDSLIQIVSQLATLIPATAQNQSTAINQVVAAGGNPAAPFAASNAINQLNSTAISNPTFSGTVSGLGASAIPDLSAKYITTANPLTGRATLGLGYASNTDVNWYYIDAWGDSLTYGGYPADLATDLANSVVYNNGVIGQTSLQIGVREGGIPTTVVVTGNGGQIPASGGVTVSFVSGYEPVTANGPAAGVPGTISGVYGTVTYTSSSATTTFTRSTSGSAVTVSGPVPFMVDLTGHNKGTVVIWAGRNDYSNSTQVESSIASMVAALAPSNRYLILSVLNSTSSTEISGTANYNTITSINSYLASTYPNNYFDIRKYLVQHGLTDAGITATTQDTLDIAHDAPPSSLHAAGDPLHLSATGYALVATQVANWITTYNAAHPTVVTYPNLTTIFSWPSFPFQVSSTTFNVIGQGGLNTSLTGNSNTAIGYYALSVATTTNYDTAIGYAALQNDTAGGTGGASHDNTAVGASALKSNTYGYYNTAHGYNSLYSNTTGYDNSALGFQSLYNNTTGNSNQAFGYQSLFNNTTGSNNFGIGFQSVYSNTTGNYNLGIGTYALQLSTSTSNNVGVGYQALQNAADPAVHNVAFGNTALQALTYGQYNTAAGNNAASSITTGGYNTAFGYSAAGGTTAFNNTSIGAFALPNTTSGSYNVGLGSYAGYQNTTGGSNIFIGYGAGYQDKTGAGTAITGNGNIVIGTNLNMIPNAGSSNQLDIGNLVFGTGLTSGSTISSGNVGIGTTTPYSRLSVWGPDTASTTAFQVVNNASTTAFAVYDNGNATYSGSIFQSSDQRLKTNIQSLDASSSLALINHLNPVTYNWADPDKGLTLQFGFIAQQVLPYFPDLVATTSPTARTPDGTLTLNYVGLISPIVKAIQVLSSGLSSLQNTVAGLTQSITSAVGNFGRINTDELCVQGTCVTGAQLQALLAATQRASSSSMPPSANSTATSSSGTSPIIKINGNNPAVIHVGDIYSDLGATITGPQADLNLGINTFVNGTLASNIAVDTTKAGTSTVEYVVTDQSGLTSTSTRTVVIQPIPSPAPATTTTSVATTTTATTTTLKGAH